MIDPLAGREVAVGHGALGFQEWCGLGRLRDTDELHRENGLSFAFSSPFVKWIRPLQ